LLVERAQRAEAVIQHLGGLPKRGVVQRGIDITEGWVVENVECLRSKLQREPVMQMNFAPHGEICLECPESSNEIPRGITGGVPRRKAECSGVYCPPTRILRSVKIKLLAGHDVDVAIVLISR
jgi:hypothetical protein